MKHQLAPSILLVKAKKSILQPKLKNLLINETIVICRPLGRALGTLLCLSSLVCNACIVTKRYVLLDNCLNN